MLTLECKQRSYYVGHVKFERVLNAMASLNSWHMGKGSMKMSFEGAAFRHPAWICTSQTLRNPYIPDPGPCLLTKSQIQQRLSSDASAGLDRNGRFST